MLRETAIADVFNREYQAHPATADWPEVMRSVAHEIAHTLHPDSAEDRDAFLDAANLSGLFIDR